MNIKEEKTLSFIHPLIYSSIVSGTYIYCPFGKRPPLYKYANNAVNRVQL